MSRREINTAEPTVNAQERIDEYGELLVKRDQYLKEAGSYLTVYTAEFGDLLTANFELKIECIKKKKTISYCRRRLNRGLPIDVKRMHEEVEKEMTLYYVQLKDMINNTETAKKAENVGQYRYNHAKKIYRRLAKVLHPDINKLTMENETLKDIWTRIVEAYHKSDIDEISDLEALASLTLSELGDDAFEIDIPDIEDRIERLEHQINEILTTEPYIYGEILKDEEKKNQVKEQLQAEHDDYEQYLESLTKALDELLAEGGALIRSIIMYRADRPAADE